MLSRFFVNDTATTEVYTLALRDALPISRVAQRPELGSGLLAGSLNPGNARAAAAVGAWALDVGSGVEMAPGRSEEHTSELQSRQYLVCRLLLEKKSARHILARRANRRLA